ncbi:MAG: hypothetical protein ACTSVI_06380 [Promethearchaeota archaeon]
MVKKKKQGKDSLDFPELDFGSSNLSLNLPDVNESEPTPDLSNLELNLEPSESIQQVTPVQDVVSKKPVKNVVAKKAETQKKAKAHVPKKLAPLPELPAFVKPEDIVDAPRFDYAPTEGKGKIKEIIWNVKVADQAKNIVSRQSRKLTPLMQEALQQIKQLGVQPVIPKVAPQVRQPTRAPSAAAAPKPRPRPAPSSSTTTRPRPAPSSRASRGTTKPSQSRTSSYSTAPQKKEKIMSGVDLSVPHHEEKSIPKAVVKSALTDEVLVPQQPITRSTPIEAKPVMSSVKSVSSDVPSFTRAESASTVVESRATQSQETRVSSSQYKPTFASLGQSAAPAATTTQPAGKPDGVDKLLPGGRRVCGRCGSSKFREEDDKSRPLSFTPPYLYAKKYICKNCGKIFKPPSEQDSASESQGIVSREKTAGARPSGTPARQVSAPRPSAVMTTEVKWEEDKSSGVKVESLDSAIKGTGHVKPSDVFAREGWKREALPKSVNSSSLQDHGSGRVQESSVGAGTAGSPAASTQEGVHRLVCPNCGSTSFNVKEDRSRPVSYGMGSGMGVIYAKIHICKKCGTRVD